jgi:hypothetical protein
LVWLRPWDTVLTRLNVGPQGCPLAVGEVRTQEDIPVGVEVQVLYQPTPALFMESLLPQLPFLNEGGWTSLITWRTNHLLRQLVADYAWRQVGKQNIRERLERHLTQLLAEVLAPVGLKVMAACLVHISLPESLQRGLIQAEREVIETWGRALALQKYVEVFGDNLDQVMPHLVKWELVNALQHNGKVQLVLTDTALLPDAPSPDKATPTLYQLSLPLLQEN